MSVATKQRLVSRETQPSVVRLESAFREVLGEEFEDAIRSLVESSAWYSNTLEVSEIFRLWVCDNILRPDDPQWIFQPLRASERKFLSEALGLCREAIVGKTPRALANTLLSHAGLPAVTVIGLQALDRKWGETTDLIDCGEDEKAASIVRGIAERFLRQILYFYCYLGHVDTLAEINANPGTLRVPRKLSSVLSGQIDKQIVLGALEEDGWADLGFLTIVLRKFSTKLEEKGLRMIAGPNLRIFGQEEHKSFLSLSNALQPYAHDRPSRAESRQSELAAGVRSVHEAIRAMSKRNVVPDQVLVLETCESVTGPVFRGLTENRETRHLAAEKAPPLGKLVWFVATTSRDLARCVWAPVPWP